MQPRIAVITPIIGLIAAATLAAAPPQQVAIPDPAPRSESITSTTNGALIIASMATGEIFRAAKGASTAKVWIQPGTSGLQRILGVFADEKTDTLWVCSSPASPGAGTTALKTFHLQSGAPTGSYEFPGGTGLCNDIAIAPDGTVYATDTTGGRVVRLKKGAHALDVWAQDSRLNGADGIAFGDDSTIYVNSYFSGQLLRIPMMGDGAAGPITDMQTSQPLTHPDGMRTLAPNIFLLIEGAGRLDRVTLNGTRATIEVLKSGFETPTAVTRVGHTAWVLAAMTANPPLVHAVPLADPAPAAQPSGASNASGHDWPMMGYNVQGDNASPNPTGITAANLKTLTRRQVKLDGTVDSSAIYLHAVAVNGAVHNAFFVTTTYGKTIAIDADSGAILWEYTPAHYRNWAGTRQITNATPAAAPDRRFIYAASPDGRVNKLAVADGHRVWATSVTLAPASEKLASPLKVFRGRLVVVTGGYIGDRPPYQGHVAIVDAASGKLLHVWNSLCSDRPALLQPTTCSGQQSAIWGRSGPAIDPATGNIFVSTGNGNYDGTTNWADSLIELNPDATKMLGNWTPTNNAEINRGDFDLITTPMLMGDGVIVQTGKDIQVRVLSLKNIAGTAAHAGHELQVVTGPGTPFITLSLAEWSQNGRTWLFAADEAWRGPAGGLAAWTFQNRRLTPVWKNNTPATAPILAGGLLYAYDGYQGSLRVYNPETGAPIAALPCGTGHWNSPIVVDGRIALPEGNANDHATSGILDIWSLPGH